MEQTQSMLVQEWKLGNETILLHINENIYGIAQTWASGMHNHSVYEIHFLLSGVCNIDVDGKNHLLKAGQAMVISPGQYHLPVAFTQDQKRLTVGMLIENGNLHNSLIRAMIDRNIYELSEDMMILCKKILSESMNKGSFYRELIRVRTTELILLLLRQLDVQIVPEIVQLQYIRYQDEIDVYFENNLANNPSAEDLAGKLHISRRQLHRILMETYGMGFRQKLLTTRMNQAKWLLRYTDKPVCRIVGEVGYTHDSAFLQAFRREFGMTPQTYRLMHKDK